MSRILMVENKQNCHLNIRAFSKLYYYLHSGDEIAKDRLIYLSITVPKQKAIHSQLLDNKNKVKDYNI